VHAGQNLCGSPDLDAACELPDPGEELAERDVEMPQGSELPLAPQRDVPQPLCPHGVERATLRDREDDERECQQG
jgi:hypothetical protein